MSDVAQQKALELRVQTDIMEQLEVSRQDLLTAVVVVVAWQGFHLRSVCVLCLLTVECIQSMCYFYMFEMLVM